MSVKFLSDPKDWNALESAYISVREKEGRIYSDEALAKLPKVAIGHPLSKEWMFRNDSFQTILKYLKTKPYNSIMDLGCGNGWMCNNLSLNGYEVTGVDVNQNELEQAARVFNQANTKWIFADIFQAEFEEKYDVIIISAALQYFKKPSALLSRLFQLLNPGGEVIIMDTFFYKPSEKDIARERSHTYYHSLDADFMIDHYHHHTLIELEPYSYFHVYKPSNSLFRRWSKRSPFPIIGLHKQE